ncbi:MAG TPA: glycosyltransferase [Actinomycetota bacterium]|nr:glycosyltransferase [Actinomycetota bacterium]
MASSSEAAGTPPPSVLVVLVVKDGAVWLRRTLASIRRQTHGRLAVVAVDNASSDGSTQILTEALGEDRVIRLNRNGGFPAAVAAALSIPVAHRADFIFLIHDDTVLAPDTVSLMVAAAGEGEGAGVVGPKVLDWERPRVLREIGLASDPFGYPYSPLEEDEIDQGQYDSPREVLFVSSAAMLISRDAWLRAGLFDERLGTCHADLDFCWRVRLAGFRVVMNPGAVVLHRAAGQRGERPGWTGARERYLAERAGLMSLLKNYRLLSLGWVLPLYAFQGIGKVFLFLLSRRFADAGQVVAAWGWNVVHLPGTIRRRVRGHAVRRARDRDVARFMAPAGTRLRRWGLQAASVLLGSRTGPLEPEEAVAPPVARRVLGFIAAHPVGLSLGAAVVLTAVAFRGVLFLSELEGGSLPVFPSGATDLFREFGSGWRSTGFGGADGASPALFFLGVGSAITLGSPRLLVRILIVGGPLLAGASCYRAVLRMTSHRLASLVAAGCYALSALTMWVASEGRIAASVFLIAIPWVLARIVEAFRGPIHRPGRWAVGTGMALAVTASFFPALWLAVAVIVGSFVVLPESFRNLPRGVGFIAATVGIAAVLLFPFTLTIIRAGGDAAVDAAGVARYGSVLRLSAGGAPGSWEPAFFLPLAGTLALAVSGNLRQSRRLALAAGVALLLAWLAAAGRLPGFAANPLAYLGVAAVSLSVLVAYGMAAERRELPLDLRQLVWGSLAAVVAIGIALQSAQAFRGAWAIGQDRIPPAWSVVSSASPGVPFRVLWLGGPGGRAFVPPGGVPDGVIVAGKATVRYGVTGRDGRSALSLGLPPIGDGYDHLHRVATAILRGTVRHGGALLATLGVHYVVTDPRDLPAAARRRLSQQVDLDLIQRAGGMSVYRNARALPEAWSAPGTTFQIAARSDRLTAPARAYPVGARSLDRLSSASWGGGVTLPEAGVVIAATSYDARWRLQTEEGTETLPFRAFGWGLGFDAPAADTRVLVSFRGQGARSLQLTVLAALWLAALWFTRRGSGGIDETSLRKHNDR